MNVATKEPNSKTKQLWFDLPISGVPQEIANRHFFSDTNLQEHIDKLKSLTVDIPKSFYRKMDVRTLYKKLIVFCEKQDCPANWYTI